MADKQTKPIRRPNRRTWQVSVRLRPDQGDRLRALAAEQNVTPQEVIRQMLAAV